MSSILKAGLAAVVVIAGVQVTADTAHARKAHHRGKQHHSHHHKQERHRTSGLATVTDIRDCADISPAKRDQCISRSRPISGAAIYYKHMTPKHRALARLAAAASVVPASGAARLALAKDGSTDIRTCAKVQPAKRDECISRSRPVKGSALAGLAAAQVIPAKAKTTFKVAAAAVVASLTELVGTDGTTDIEDCAKVVAGLRDRCISMSRPVPGVLATRRVARAEINDSALEAAAKAAAIKAVTAIRNIFAKDGTTDVRDCSRVDPSLRERCISVSRPVTGLELMQRS